MATNFAKELGVHPGKKVKLGKYDPEDTLGWEKDDATKEALDKTLKKIDNLQYLLYAGRKHALLVVLQAMDTGGKDGTIRHVMAGVNPQGCRVVSFKIPSAEEREHDFLWRIHTAMPALGEIGIFNRSHYEDVLVVRVHELVPKDVWRQRYEQINEFEAYLTANGVKILKFYLHISKDEQKKRMEDRIQDKEKRWKISEADFKERQYWDEYTDAYQDTLTKCSTKDAPWFIIPSNKKWFRNLAVSHIIAETLEDMKMNFPAPTVNVKKLKFK